jgi:hypothetical protein
MLGHVALDEQRAHARVEAARDEHRREVERGLAQILRILRHGDRVQVDDGVERVHLVLLPDPAADRPDVVPEVLLARRLDSGENAHVGPIIPH